MNIIKKISLIVGLLSFGNIVYSNPSPAIICNHHQDCGNGGGGYYTPAPVVYTVPDYYGAVAAGFDKNDSLVIGWGTQQTSERKAKKIALSECVKKGGVNCKSLARVRNNCIAVLIRYDLNRITRASPHFGTKNEIYKKAEATCQPSDISCTLTEFKCSTDPRFMYKLDDL